ncbi:uncharacterized protein BX664DRAFT_291080 [Halteromyces radiatus]|uniref:uncharacterized protein n=1 Tax=Halteromyces radiatus TaxID=101107 RepID=UPI00221E7711|nr:uncharacterized protein BX664DRAFT_291080 [Halteromyces radiatus]KAI8096288.1 hypothetical protein BX664DRAFT_291080 [Halteromyces radiatus]
MSTSKIVAVTGVTGKQGGAVARKLLELGHKVRGITRNTASPSAVKMAEKGVEMVNADMGDLESMKTAFTGVDSVFVVTQMSMFNHKTEVKQGKIAADAAKSTGVNHFVFTSVGNSENAPNVPHFASKWEIERYIRDQLQLPYTIIRPSFFMENYQRHGQMAPANGTIKGMIPGNVKLQMIAVEDIGKVAATAIDHRDKYLNQVIELSGDELTGNEMADVLSKVSGEPYTYSHWWLFRYVLRHFVRGMGAMADFFVKVGYKADIPKLRQEFPELQTWETWLNKNGFAKDEPSSSS